MPTARESVCCQEIDKTKELLDRFVLAIDCVPALEVSVWTDGSSILLICSIGNSLVDMAWKGSPTSKFMNRRKISHYM